MATVETLALAGLRVIASPVMKKLVDKAFSYVGMDVPRDLKDLVVRVLPQLAIATRVSEETSIDMDELMPWIQKLKDTYDEAEDILDEVEYQTIAKKIKDEKRFMVRITSIPLIKSLAEYTDRKGEKFSFLSSKKRKLWSRLNNLKNDVKGLIDVAQVLYAVRTQPIRTPVRETSSFPQSTIFVGRDSEHRHIVDELIKQPVPAEKKSYPVIAIVGIGGAGKTTLAQHIYQNDRVATYFDMRIWVSLTRKIDVIKDTKAMIQNATSGEECPISSTLQELHSKLIKILSRSKRVLLVLDDLLYNKNEDGDWKSLLVPFNSINGSKAILLTSRNYALPEDLRSEKKFIYLDKLIKDDSIKLFRHHACLDKIKELPLRNELEVISVQIVKKLSLYTLAIESVASQFKDDEQKVEKWINILNDSNINLNKLKLALNWSYQQLDKALQRCFLLCSIVPKGLKFDKIDLVPLWLALNYIRSSEYDNKPVEVIGSEYFDNLVSRLFFKHADQTGSSFIMHDEFHHLAESLTQGECFRIEDEREVEIPLTVRHLSISVGNIKRACSRHL